MIKSCVVLGGKIINVGDWDYHMYTDELGNEIVNNPLPDGAVIEERDFEYSEAYGWREVGFVPEPTEIEKLKQENILLKAQNQALADRTDFHEDLIAEMAMMLYP